MVDVLCDSVNQCAQAYYNITENAAADAKLMAQYTTMWDSINAKSKR